jgi:endonuclease V-like protein UPF0215 family
MGRPSGNVIGFDDAPFSASHRGDVGLIGAVFCRTRLDGVLCSKARRDGTNATRRLIEMVKNSQFDQHIRAVLLQGIAVAGFNVIDIQALYRSLGRPVLVVARRRPDLSTIRETLLTRVKGGERKWKLIERAGNPEPLRGIFVQRAGMTREQAERLLEITTLHGKIPEPLRVAHLIAGGVTDGVSRGRA